VSGYIEIKKIGSKIIVKSYKEFSNCNHDGSTEGEEPMNVKEFYQQSTSRSCLDLQMLCIDSDSRRAPVITNDSLILDNSSSFLMFRPCVHNIIFVTTNYEYSKVFIRQERFDNDHEEDYVEFYLIFL
jgi:hypothetical protein